jgi:pyruvate/2-oxoglutarate dehydrogenase complex dihydrolipoamide dehydrogenase (E3) component
MTATEQLDAIILGAGQAGNPLSTTLANAGWKTALIEREHVGGTCINEGCTPTKTLVASARVAHVVQRAAGYGVQTGTVTVDLETVRQRKRDIVQLFRSGSRQRMEATDGLELIMGEARFVGSKEIEVTLNSGGTRRLAADKIFINTGARPRVPHIAGLAGVPYLDSTTIMELGAVPEQLLIVGGGYVGVEFGQMFRRFGSDVTIIQHGEQILPHEDRDVADAVIDILREDGIHILLQASPTEARLEQGGAIRVEAKTPDGVETLTGSHLLIAAGRVPNTDILHLEATGVETDSQGHIVANERLETSVPGIYALGDVKGGPAFTHISYDDFRIVRANLLEDGDRTTGDRQVPYTVFIDPQLGRIGLTEKQAREAGLDILVGQIPMSSVSRALEVDETRGLMKAVVDADTGRILGAATLGIEGGEIMAIIQVAMMGDLPYTALRDAVFAHPTLAESLNSLFAALE